MSDQPVLLPKWCTQGGIILAKEQLGHSYTFWTMSIMISSPVTNFGHHPLGNLGLPIFDAFTCTRSFGGAIIIENIVVVFLWFPIYYFPSRLLMLPTSLLYLTAWKWSWSKLPMCFWRLPIPNSSNIDIFQKSIFCANWNKQLWLTTCEAVIRQLSGHVV